MDQPGVAMTDVTAILAEGARVGIASCRICGAALMIDPRETWDNLAAHMDWHHSTAVPDPAVP